MLLLLQMETVWHKEFLPGDLLLSKAVVTGYCEICGASRQN
jgi:hypothetical protein